MVISERIKHLLNPSAREFSVPTEAQYTASALEIYLEKMKILSNAANRYCTQVSPAKMREFPKFEDKKTLFPYAIEALSRLHSVKDLEEKKRFMQDYGEDTYLFDKLLTMSDIALKQTDSIQSRAGTITAPERMLITIKSAFFCKNEKMPIAEREKLLTLMGYDPRKLTGFIESAILTTGLILPADILLGVTQSIPAAFGPSLNLNSPEAVYAVAGAYVLDALALGINSWMNVRNINNSHLEASPNVFATSLYMATKKIFPENKILQEASIILPSIVPTLVSEIALYPLLYLPNIGVSVTVFRNVLSAVNQGVQAGFALNMYNQAEREFIKS